MVTGGPFIVVRVSFALRVFRRKLVGTEPSLYKQDGNLQRGQ
jgi:hypothetical protein